MKKIAFLVCLLVLVSCKKESEETFGKPNQSEVSQTPEELGKSIFEGKGNCAACHRIDEKLVGPSIQDIAKIYKAQNGDLVSFLKDEAKPIVDASQYEVMKTNLALTKEMTDEELKGLEAYIYSKTKVFARYEVIRSYSRHPLYLLWRTPPQQDAATIGAKTTRINQPKF